MLVNLKEVLEIAEQNNVAVGSFNTPNYENILAVISAAEELNVPVILMHAECHEEYSRLEDIGPIMLMFAEKAKVPVCVHLDHAEHFEYIEKAINIGFTSVMIDASTKTYDENVEITRKTVALAHANNVSVEAEIGVMGGREAGDSRPLTKEEMYTDPNLAKRFVEDTGIDALACSFGTAHGIYKVKPELDFERIKQIRSLIHLPLVMHGGSGVSEEDFVKAIDCGIRKINYYSYMSRAGVYAAREFLKNDITFFHEVSCEVINKMKENVYNPLKLFNRK